MVWNGELNIFGEGVRIKGDKDFIPFRYQGQYEDIETGLYYNRFRYYSPSEGMYISQDPIKLAGGNKFYSYVHDVNGWIDVLGLSFWKGFSKGELSTHYQKHVIDQGEFGNITQAEYLAKAKDFGDATGGAIQEADVGNFKIKHDPTTGEVFVGHTKKKEIRTYYIDDGRSPDAFADAKKLAGDLSSGCK